MNILLATILLLLATTGLWHWRKPLPPGINLFLVPRPVHEARLLIDLTWADHQGRHCQQQIHNELFRLIDSARQLIVLDVFLFSDFQGRETKPPYRPLSRELTERLLAQKQRHPAITIILITDPVNSLYGGIKPDHWQQLQDAGITLIETRLSPLRDPNPLWSSLWRLLVQPLGNSASDGWLPNPMDNTPSSDNKVTLRSYLHLLNFKANHRKTLVVDHKDQWLGLVSSANPHDGSSAHSNLGLVFSGNAVVDLLQSELAVARLSAKQLNLQQLPDINIPQGDATDAKVQVLTEVGIRQQLLCILNNASTGDQLCLSVFYLSHRKVIKAIKQAHQRGVQLRIMLDPNKDAFGRQRGGIPNRQVALELHRAGLPIRWQATHGEQAHSKYLLWLPVTGQAQLLTGSANFTRRNLDNYNLETSVSLYANKEYPAIQQCQQLFENLWHNQWPENLPKTMEKAPAFTLPYEAHADSSRWKYGLYRVIEFSGWCTF